MARVGTTRRSALLTLAITLAVASLLSAPNTAVAAPEPAQHVVQAPKSPLPVALWRACPVGDRAAAEQRVVRTFERSPGNALGRTMPAGPSDLVCGTDNFGYYHIVNRHYVEWTQKGQITSENWRSVADYSIKEALRSPEQVTYDPTRSTFCYSRNIYLVNKVTGAIVTSFHPNVIVIERNGQVLTAWPGSIPCRAS